jgi:voltage-gated potassium channel
MKRIISISFIFLATLFGIFSSTEYFRDTHSQIRFIISFVIGFYFLYEYLRNIFLATRLTAHYSNATKLNCITKYVFSFLGCIDFLVCIPFIMLIANGDDANWVLFLYTLSLLKLPRYIPGLAMIGNVIYVERRNLLATLLSLMILLVIFSSLLFAVESHAQPEVFKSIPHAMWWGITTLTTVGYGDMVPVTLLGRTIAASTMLIGIAMVAIPAGIIASGFIEEMRNEAILSTWKSVRSFPLFKELNSEKISEIANVLKSQVIPSGVTIFEKGSFSDSMYFIVEGEVEVVVEPKSVLLKKGAFFGEIGLLEVAPRSATVITTKKTNFLVLTMHDFHQISDRHPDILNQIRHVASQRNINQ